MTRSNKLVFVALVAAAGCGDDGGGSGTPDAPPNTNDDAAIDSPMLPAGCDYSEQADTMNDGFAQNPQRETTGLSVGAGITICGVVNNGHFAMNRVDIDSYAVMVTAGDYLVRVTGGPELANLVVASGEVYSGNDFGTSEGAADYYGDHGVRALTLPAGTLEFSMFTANMADITGTIPYKITITPDTPATRCPAITAAANHTENRDNGGNNNTGNDMVQIDLSMSGANAQVLTANANDMPEATGVTLMTAGTARFSGNFADVAVSGSYKEKDTYLFTTGAGVNEIEVRQTWTPATTGMFDADIRFFEAGTVPSVNVAAETNVSEEFQTFPVKPNTMYWIWTGLWRQSDATGVLNYDISICGKSVAP